MILKSKETTIAYRCPVCGKNIMGLVGIFTLSGDMIKLKCDCGHSEMQIAYTPDRKIRLTVPCVICPHPHSYLIDPSTFYEKDIFALPCSYCDLDICFIGSKEKVEEALRQSDEDLLGILEDAGFEDFESFRRGRDSLEDTTPDEDKVLDDPQIEDVVRFMIRELEADSDIKCGCEDGDGEYDFDFVGGYVRVFCRKCGHDTLVPMMSVTDANAFLNTVSLNLTENAGGKQSK